MKSYASPEEAWRALMTGELVDLTRFRRVVGVIPSNPRCKICKAPLAGLGAPLMRLIGRAQSTMNPTFCGACLDHMRKTSPVGTGAEIEMSMLFTDVRGSTSIAEKMSPAEFSRTMSRFYAIAGDVLTDHDALIDKLMGDQAIGLFVPGFAGPNHARRAIDAGLALQRAVGSSLPVGVGVHTGIAYIGIVAAHSGTRDITALGDSMNTAARLCSMAGEGEVLASHAACAAAGMDISAREHRKLELKGKTELVDAAVLKAA